MSEELFTTVYRSVLAGSHRAGQSDPPLLRNETSNQFGEESLELPLPVSLADTPDEMRVLHVDDDPDILSLTEECLERTDHPITVTGKASAVEGMNALQESDFDCIISDYDMPNTDGLEFLELVRETHPDIPFILYTAKGSEAVASEAISAGVTEYMQKESGLEQYEVLANRVRKAVERYRSQQQFWDALSWYHRLVERDIAGVFVVQDEEFVYVNERLADIVGCMQSELLGERPKTIAATAEDERLLTTLPDPENRCHSFDRELSVQKDNGSSVAAELHGGTIQYNDEPACLGILWERTDAPEDSSPQ